MSVILSPTTTLNSAEKHKSTGLGDFVINIGSRSTTTALPASDQQASFAIDRVQIEETTTVPLQQYPNGYPRAAAFQSSEPSWSIYRGFNYLYSRVLLELQEEIRLLEKQLTNLDRIDDENGDGKRLMSRKFDLQQSKEKPRDGGPERAELVETIRCKLFKYGEILVQAREIGGFQRPSKRDYLSFRTWFSNEKPIVELESQYIKRKEDLITLRHGREWAGFDGWIENVIRKFHCRFTHRIFATPELRAKTNDKFLFYYSSSRIEKLVGLIIAFIIMALLVLPVVAMCKVTSVGDHTSQSTFNAVGVLVVFTLLFSATMSLLTKAKRHELFAASAAYCAVLVVFIGNFVNSHESGSSMLRAL